MKRYGIEISWERELDVDACPDGEWVKYEDHAAQLRQAKSIINRFVCDIVHEFPHPDWPSEATFCEEVKQFQLATDYVHKGEADA